MPTKLQASTLSKDFAAFCREAAEAVDRGDIHVRGISADMPSQKSFHGLITIEWSPRIEIAVCSEGTIDLVNSLTKYLRHDDRT